MKKLFQIVFYGAGIAAIVMMVDLWRKAPDARCNELTIKLAGLRHDLNSVRGEFDNLSSMVLRQQSTLAKAEIFLRMREKEAADVRPVKAPKPPAPSVAPKPPAAPTKTVVSSPTSPTSPSTPRGEPGRTTVAFGTTSTGSYVRTIAAPPAAVASARGEQVVPAGTMIDTTSTGSTGLPDITAIVSTSAVHAREEALLQPAPVLPPPVISKVAPPEVAVVPAPAVPAPTLANAPHETAAPAVSASAALKRVTTTPATTEAPEVQAAPIRTSRMARARRAAEEPAFSLSMSDQIVSGAGTKKKTTMADIMNKYESADGSTGTSTNMPASPAGN